VLFLEVFNQKMVVKRQSYVIKYYPTD